MNAHNHFGVSCIKVSPCGKSIASCDYNKSVYILNASTKEVVNDKFNFHTSRVYSVDWSSDSKYLISTSLDNCTIHWDVENVKRLRTFSVLDSDLALTCSYFKDNNSFVVGGHNCSPRIISLS